MTHYGESLTPKVRPCSGTFGRSKRFTYLNEYTGRTRENVGPGSYIVTAEVRKSNIGPKITRPFFPEKTDAWEYFYVGQAIIKQPKRPTSAQKRDSNEFESFQTLRNKNTSRRLNSSITEFTQEDSTLETPKRSPTRISKVFQDMHDPRSMHYMAPDRVENLLKWRTDSTKNRSKRYSSLNQSFDFAGKNQFFQTEVDEPPRQQRQQPVKIVNAPIMAGRTRIEKLLVPPAKDTRMVSQSLELDKKRYNFENRRESWQKRQVVVPPKRMDFNTPKSILVSSVKNRSDIRELIQKYSTIDK